MVYITDQQTNEALTKLFKPKGINKNMVRQIQGKIKGLKTDQFKKKPEIMSDKENKEEPSEDKKEEEETSDEEKKE